MRHEISGGLCVVLTAVGISTAAADVWVVHDRVLERRDTDGSVVTTVFEPAGVPIGDVIDQGEVDPQTGNVWLVYHERDQTGPTDVIHVLGVEPNGELLMLQTAFGFGKHIIALDEGRDGLWVVRPIDPASSPDWEAVLYSHTTGNVLASIRIPAATTAVVGADGAIWIGAATEWIRLEGSIEELDRYEVVGSTGPHHRTFQPGPHGKAAVVDRSDGSLYFSDVVSVPSEDILEGHLVKFSAEGEQLFRVRYGALHNGVRVLWDVITDIDVARDGSIYLTTGSTFNFRGSVAHVSATGADLGTVEYREYVNSVAADPEDAVWIGHMPVVDDDKSLIAPMILRKLDPSSLQTDLSVPFQNVVTVIGAAPAAAALEISLDIETRDKRNVINLIPQKSDVRVALLSSATFDALQVDLDTVRFGTAGAVVRSYWTRDVNRDGYTDLVVTFRTQDTGITCGDTSAPLTAETHGGVDVHGTDFLQTKCKP